MNKDSILRDLLIEAELQRAERTGHEKIKPSDRFKLGINKALKEKGEAPYYGFFKLRRRRVLAVIAAVVLLFALCMSVTAVRESVMNFFIEIYDKFAVIYSDPNETVKTAVITEMYSPSFTPNGYEKVSETLTESYIINEYMNINGNKLYFEQHTAKTVFNIDTEHFIKKLNLSNGSEAVIYKSDGIISVLWNQNGYFFNIVIYGKADEQELIKMAESLRITPESIEK